MFFTNVFAQDPRERAVRARMGMFLPQHAVGRSTGGVVIDGDPGLLECEGDVRLGHAEDRHGSEGMVFDQQVEESVHRILVPDFRDLGKSLALQRKQLGVVYHSDEDRFRAGNLLPFVVPLV